MSSDQNEEAFKEYFKTMPFLALPYDSELKDELSDYFEVEGKDFVNSSTQAFIVTFVSQHRNERERIVQLL